MLTGRAAEGSFGTGTGFQNGTVAGFICIPVGKTVNLDLNGHIIDRNLEEAQADGSVIQVLGTLMLTDSGTTGKITGGNDASTMGAAGGVQIAKNGTFIMNGGIICGNASTANYNTGGGGVCNKGTFILNSGTITENSGSWGGGVENSYGSFTMNGGTISNNTATIYKGGGIYSNEGFTITGGTVTGNHCKEYLGGGGVGLAIGASVSISGNPVIKNNTSGSSTNAASDVNLPSNSESPIMPMTIIGVMTEGANIGVSSTETAPYVFAKGTDIYTVTEEDAAKFFNEKGYIAAKTESNELEFRVPVVADTPITSVTVTGMDKPSAGADPDTDVTLVTVPADKATIDKVQWYNGSTPLESGSKFEAGKEYYAYINVAPSAGYCFNSDGLNFNYAGTVTVNGDTILGSKTKVSNGKLIIETASTVVTSETPSSGINNAAVLQEAIGNAVPGSTIKLDGNIVLDNDTPLIIEGKGSVENPITLDLNGYTITGSNGQTGTPATSAEGKKAGILWISQSTVVLTDLSSNAVKGGIINDADKNSICGILLTSPSTGDPASLTIKNGVRVEIENGQTGVRPLCIYEPSTSAPEISLIIDDVAVKTSGSLLNPTNKANTNVVVNGGTFETTAGKPFTSDSAFAYTTINGGTFSGAFSYTVLKSSIGSDKVAVYDRNGDGKIITTVQSLPASYAAHISAKGTDTVYTKVYLASGGDLGVFAEAGLLVSDETIEIKENTSCTYPAGKTFGSATGAVSNLTLDIKDEVVLSGSMPLGLADVIVTGNGQVADNFFVAGDSENLELINTGNVYTCSLKADKLAAKLTYASGKVSVYTSVSAALNSAQASDCTLDIFTDYDTASTFTASGNLTLNLNGNNWTYTGTGCAFKTSSNSGKTMTIKNGTVIVAEGANAAVELGNFNNPGHLIVESDAVIKGNTIIVDKTGSTLTVYGTIDTTGTNNPAIIGNGSSTKDSIITIKEGAVIKSDVLAIYHPQDGVLTIEGGNISGSTGVEMRGGELNITGGEITATGEYSVGETPDGGGSSISGVAIAVSPYADKEVSANITGGTLNGGESGKAFAQVTAIDVPVETLTSKPEVSISGGNFNGEVVNDMKNSNGEVVDCDSFISGGSFSNDVGEYVVEDLKYAVNNDSTFTYYPTLEDAIAAATDPDAVITRVPDQGTTPEASKDTLTLDYSYESKTRKLVVLEGETITLPTPESRTGYTFDGWYIDNEKVTEYSGSAEGKEVTITAKWKKNSSPSGGGVVSSYTLTFDTNGGSAIGKITKFSGTTVDLTSYKSTKEGYDFTGWYSDKALTEKVTSVKLIKNTTVYAKWTEKVVAPVELPFTDINEKDWFYDDVAFVFENGMMEGIPGNLFAPNASTTRGMIVTILYRLEGEPTVSGGCPFGDVNAGSWYEDAIIWAVENKIVDGYGNSKYGPEDAITREQMAAILYRYADYKGYDVAVQADLSKFTDNGEISTWAEEAFSWANANDLVEGDGVKIMPDDNAERCQIAAILHRFCENVAE